jgi:prophage antirepressor-like protein
MVKIRQYGKLFDSETTTHSQVEEIATSYRIENATTRQRTCPNLTSQQMKTIA